VHFTAETQRSKAMPMMLIYLTSYDLLALSGLVTTAAMFFVAFILVR
jgi:hypothetical protein